MNAPADAHRWGLCILCILLIVALCSSYYLQVKKIRAVHETVVSIFAGMVVGLIIRLSPGHLIREMLVSQDVLLYPGDMSARAGGGTLPCSH